MDIKNISNNQTIIRQLLVLICHICISQKGHIAKDEKVEVK